MLAGEVAAGKSVNLVLTYDITEQSFQTVLQASVLITTSGRPAAKVRQSLPVANCYHPLDACPVSPALVYHSLFSLFWKVQGTQLGLHKRLQVISLSCKLSALSVIPEGRYLLITSCVLQHLLARMLGMCEHKISHIDLQSCDSTHSHTNSSV